MQYFKSVWRRGEPVLLCQGEDLEWFFTFLLHASCPFHAESVWGGVNQCAMQGHSLGYGLQMQAFEFKREHTTFQKLLPPVRPKNLLHIFLKSLGMKQPHQQLFCRGQPGRSLRMGQARGGLISETTSTALQSPRQSHGKQQLRVWAGSAGRKVKRGCSCRQESICTAVTQRICAPLLPDEQKTTLPLPALHQ